MAIDIFNTDGNADATNGPVKHGTAIVNYGVATGINRFYSNSDRVDNLPIITDVSGKFDQKFDDPTYYTSG